VSAAISLDGFRIEIFFSEEMRDNSAFTDPANYVLADLIGATASSVSVVPGTPGIIGGYTSAIVTHSGTTLGGTYTVTVSNVEDMAGNPLNLPSPANQAQFIAFGDTPTYTVTAVDGDTLEFAFFDSQSNPQEMLTEAEFTPGIEDSTSYGISTTYPVPLAIGTITHPAGGDLSKSNMDVSGMTSATYDVAVSPAAAIEYDGSILPSASTAFNGVEQGTGVSTASAATKLLMTKNVGDFYGWAFEDTSGKILPSSSFRMDFEFDASVAVYSPPLFDAVLGSLSMSDGVVQVDVFIQRIGGVDAFVVSSGAFARQVPASWSTGPTTITLVRNQKADHYAILINGSPVISAPTASLTGAPTINAGSQFLLTPVYQITGMKVSSNTITSSQTVFTSTWNFLHGISGAFTGSSLLANDRLLTNRGPLVKGWGDATPATVQDVAIRVNGTPVAIRSVNPYTGTIFPEVPIPRMPAGTITVEADYTWFPGPAFEMVGLNTTGLVLNKWDRPTGHTAGAVSPSPSTATGAIDYSRFPMGVVLAPMERPKPIEIGHRYMGFEREYSALTNSPTTLLLNQSPHRVSVPGLESSCEGANVTFNGETTPQQAELPWTLDGVDDGSVQGDGTYLVVDSSSGSYSLGTATVYSRDESLDCEGSISIAARLQAVAWEPDGVFTGIGLGFHDNFRLYLAGLLVVHELRHVGLLTDATAPHLVDSWSIGPGSLATITSSTTFTVPADEFPETVEAGSRFQVLEGPQTGVYTISDCGIDEFEGTITVTLDSDTPFPADPSLYGNNTATVLFETPWDENQTTYRVLAVTGEDTDDGRQTQLFIGGSLSGVAVTLLAEEVAAIPADTSLLLPTGDQGMVFWGSLSRLATNSAAWSLYRYSVTPNALLETMRGLVVAAEMSDPPEDDSNHEWWFTNKFGYSEIDSSGDTLLLKSTSASPDGSLDLSFGYARLEPALTNKVYVDVDSHFQVETGVLGAGDATIRVGDSIRQVQLATLLYREGGGSPGDPYRRLTRLPATSLSGLLTPDTAGWAIDSSWATPPTTSARGQTFTMTKQSVLEGIWRTNLTLNDDSSGGRIFEARLAISNATLGSDDTIGPLFGAHVGSGLSLYDVRVVFKGGPERVILTDSTGTEHGSFAFTWSDEEFHTYRVVADPTAANVVLIIDDVVQGSVALASFAAATDDLRTYMGAVGDGASISTWDSFHNTVMPLPSAKRTLGVLLGGENSDPDDIDSWQIPRTDSLDVPNSDASATIEEMDWTSLLRTRVHLDQAWGVSIYRPDLPPPPWFTGDFVTEITDPTAAWINVEYRYLPLNPDVVGSVSFGSLDPRAITQQRWKEVRYRLYNTPSEEYIQPQGMVLNRYNVIHSGEFNTDITPEVVTVTSLTSTLASIRSAHMNADRVFNVVVSGSVLPSTDWTFNQDTQTILLANPLPANEYPVTITFAPAKPVTSTYLCSQPFEQSVTKLNEGTPPFPLHQTEEATRQVVSGSQINDPTDTLGDEDFILNDPYQSVHFTDPEGALYDCLKFCEVDNGGTAGLLSIACDGPAPEAGLVEMALEGPAYRDGFTVRGGPGGPWGSSVAGSPVIKGSATAFDQTSILHASGGSYVDGVLGPGTAVMYPNFPGEGYQGDYNSPAALQGMGLNQETKWKMVYTEVFEDTLDLAGTASDNTPPSYADPTVDPNPDGTPGVHLHGAAAAQMVEYVGDAAKDRLGPWGGLTSLGNSLLGGGAALTGVELTLNGGAPVPGPTTTNFQIEAAN